MASTTSFSMRFSASSSEFLFVVWSRRSADQRWSSVVVWHCRTVLFEDSGWRPTYRPMKPSDIVRVRFWDRCRWLSGVISLSSLWGLSFLLPLDATGGEYSFTLLPTQTLHRSPVNSWRSFPVPGLLPTSVSGTAVSKTSAGSGAMYTPYTCFHNPG